MGPAEQSGQDGDLVSDRDFAVSGGTDPLGRLTNYGTFRHG